MERFAIKIDKKLKANLYKICRLCGIDNPDMVPIIPDKKIDMLESPYIDVEAEMEMQQKINLLIGLSITKDDKMPQTMCCLCVDKINDFYEFREMCYATNAQTRKLLGLKNIKKTSFDIKPKVEIKEESIVPTSTLTPVSNKNGNRKRKSDDVALKEESPDTAINISKKKLRFSLPGESSFKEDISGLAKKKLRFTTLNEDSNLQTATTSKKSKGNTIEESKMNMESSPPTSLMALAVSNKKLRLATQKEYAAKKSKQKSVKNLEQKETEVKEEIKEEIKEEAVIVPTPLAKLKFGCNICKERFHAKVNLDTHIKTAHVPKIERYVCTACNEVLTKSFDIKNHQLWHKLSKTPYVCGCCGESILNTYAFSRHLREHAFETPPALLVLDRECPQCHISYATNFLYNIHICALKTKRCAGCNRFQRNDAEYLKHSAQCAKVYLNYSKHIMPSVEALEDAVRIKNENDVEAAAEEMARISGVPLDMAPVVQLTRLSSPLIMAASQCVSMAGLDDVASSSGKKSSKKGVSKRDLKRVDELLKSTLDALVSIKHEPEVHVEQEVPSASEHSENEDNQEINADGGDLDDFHDDDSDNNSDYGNTSLQVAYMESSVEPIKIKQEIDETSEENTNKIGGGLKLKIKKEHGQLNSSIIEQLKSSEKRGEKRKKKKKHKDKEKERHKLPKDVHDEYVPQDMCINSYNSDTNIETTTVRIKSEPQEGSESSEKPVASVLQARPQPEATIMTSIPMMQFQIACVSSGVEFNNGTNTLIESHQIIQSANQGIDSDDVKPNREELDRILKISHVSSGIAMDTDDVRENETQQMDSVCNYDKGNNREDEYHEGCLEGDQHNDENKFEYQDDNNSEHRDDEQEDEDKFGNDVGDVPEAAGIDKDIIKETTVVTQPKTKLFPTPKEKPAGTVAKSRNKACKSTAKPPSVTNLQISAVQSGISLEPTPSTSDFAPIFIKPEPQNRGYSDEQPTEAFSPTHSQPAKDDHLSQAHNVEEQNYISTIDFNNITIKQEKDIEINDVQITQTSINSFTELNGVKRKRKQVLVSHRVKGETEHDIDDKVELEEDKEEEEENYEEELGDDEEEEEEEDDDDEGVEDDDEEVEDDEEREYRELEYPPQLFEKTDEQENQEYNAKAKENNDKIMDEHSSINENIKTSPKDLDSSNSLVITSVCSQVTDLSKSNDKTVEQKNNFVNYDNVLLPKNVCDTDDCNLKSNFEQDQNKTLELSSSQDEKGKEISSLTEHKESHGIPLSPVAHNNDISITTNSMDIPAPQTDTCITNTFKQSQTRNSCTSTFALEGTIEPHEISLEVVPNRQMEVLNSSQNANSSDFVLNSSQSAQNSSGQLQNLGTHLQMSSKQEYQEEFQSVSKQRPRSTSPSIGQDSALNKDSNIINAQGNLQNILQHSTAGAQNDFKDLKEMKLKSHSFLENLPENPTFDVVSKASQSASEIIPGKKTVVNELSNTPFSNYDHHKTSKDNQNETATIRGVVQQVNDANSEARPITENCDTKSTDHDRNNENANEDQNEFELEEDDNNNDESTLGNNLEECQNYQNQEVLAHIRPTALALHPYLEDISSSSNSLLSNSLSQTPPLQPATSAACIDEFNIQRQRQQQHRLLNTEETENILNESADAYGRRSIEVAETLDVSVAQQLPQPHLSHQLPLHMPTFNFDNINEIAENNNNANIEREQLQDEQQQHT